MMHQWGTLGPVSIIKHHLLALLYPLKERLTHGIYFRDGKPDVTCVIVGLHVIFV